MDRSGTRGISLKRYRQFFRRTVNEVEFSLIKFKVTRPLDARKKLTVFGKKGKKGRKEK